jgi:hypothetical protein
VSGPRFIVIGAVLNVAAALSLPATAEPVPGFRQDWPGTDLHGWTSGAGHVNPGSGGTLGATDGYLVMFRESEGFLATYCPCPELQGDWRAAGITTVKFSINDVGADQNLEIHFVIGESGNLWLYTPGFVPPENQWAEFVVDLTDTASFTRIIGTGSFAGAFQNVELVQLRHDLAPFMQAPNPIQADVGIDGLELAGALVEVLVPALATPVELGPPFPNPARGPVTVSFRTADGEPVRLEIVDVSGRIIRRVDLGAAAPGPRLWLWDGRDQGGRMVAPGSYRVRVRGPVGGMSRPLVRTP